MTSRGWFTLIALALALAFVVAFVATREPACLVKGVYGGRGKSLASFQCESVTPGR